MPKVQVALTSVIQQEGDVQTLQQAYEGELTVTPQAVKVVYQEAPDCQVKLWVMPKQITLMRQSRDQETFLRLALGEKKPCHYLVQGHRLEMTSTTQRLTSTQVHAKSRQVKVEYELFSGLYLVGNYRVTLLFTDRPSMIGKD